MSGTGTPASSSSHQQHHPEPWWPPASQAVVPLPSAVSDQTLSEDAAPPHPLRGSRCGSKPRESLRESSSSTSTWNEPPGRARYLASTQSDQSGSDCPDSPGHRSPGAWESCSAESPRPSTSKRVSRVVRGNCLDDNFSEVSPARSNSALPKASATPSNASSFNTRNPFVIRKWSASGSALGFSVTSSSGSGRESPRNTDRSSSPRSSAYRGGRACLPALQAMRRKAAPRCRALIKNRVFQLAMLMALVSALFLPDLWVLIDRPSYSDLDVILLVVLALFLVELVIQSVGLTRTYWGSFFFWMDLLGAASLLLDLSFVLRSDHGDSVSNNVVIMRAARVAKLGARAGRFTKLVKLLRFLPGMRAQGSDQGTAKVISARLITALSTRVSCLIIVMVMVMPLFSMWTYPEQDWSMKSFLDILEKAAMSTPERFKAQFDEFVSFYDDKDYYPYSFDLKRGSAGAGAASAAALLPWASPRGLPRRITNSVRYESASLVCYFNFKRPNQVDSLMNMLLLVVIMVLMVGFSLLLANSVSAIVLRPLEKLLMQVRKMASTIFQSVSDMALTMKDEEDGDVGLEKIDEDREEGSYGATAFGNETELLEKVVQKLAVLSEITMNKSVVDDETLQGLGEGDRAVIHGYQGGGVAGGDHGCGDATEDDTANDDGYDYEGALFAQRAMMESAGLSLDLLNSWSLNPLELDRARNHAAAMYFVGPHNHGVAFDAVAMAGFLERAEAGYAKACPYHNWHHAVDVTHGIYRLLQIWAAELYLSNLERYALLISAICHDVGHPGLNNTFLIETSHELALRYNDKSPLENMHCSRLFELISIPKCNIFATMSRPQFQELRKICIEAILHTDNAQHFAMIKEVQMMYEVNSEILDASREFYNDDPEEFPTREAVECFRQPESRRLLVKLMLHMADISNSMKPFRISRIWAWQVLEEFFMQGDAERKLGVPVQALNERERVNRAFSQIGFIEFLVSPFLFAIVKVLPPTEPCADQMVRNVRSWHQLWAAETEPPPTEAERAALADRVSKLESKYVDCQ